MWLSLFGFLLGVTVGLLLGFFALVALVWLFTKRHDAEADGIPQRRRPHERVTVDRYRHVMHPNIMKRGRFASYVWIVAGDKWDIAQPIHKFPPPDCGTGETKGLVKYYAEIRDGWMMLSWEDVQRKHEVMKIDLEGCSCRLVDECLGTKSAWWRKAPLEIRHPDRVLYDGCNKALIFCLHGSDKEQWFIGLSMYDGLGQNIRDIQKIYRRYSKNFRSKTDIRFPNEHGRIFKQEEATATEKNPWFTGWRRGANAKTSMIDATSASTQPVELAEEIEQLWNGGKSRTVFAEEQAKRSFKSSGRKNKGWKHERRPSGSNSTSDQKTLSTTAPNQPCLDDAPASVAPPDDEATNPSSGAIPKADPSVPSTPQSPPHSSRSNSSKSSMNEGIYGLNMFLARWSFDLARNPEFEQKFRAFIEKKLSGLQRPNYVTPLKLQTFNMGSNFPEIRSIRALPPRGTIICPELLVDLSYAGGLEITVETSVNLKENAIWDGNAKLSNRPLQAVQPSDRRPEPMESIPDGSEMEGCDATMTDDDVTSMEDKTSKGLGKIAKRWAKQVFTDFMAEPISKISFKLAVKVLKLEGTLLIWMSPPPAKRLWVSFIQTPTIEIAANPILGTRIMNNYAPFRSVTSWLQKKIKESFFRNLVFPNCGDLSFPGILGLMDADGLQHPSLAVMHDLLHVSENDSEDEIVEAPLESIPITPTVEAIATADAERMSEATRKPAVQLPVDDRSTFVRRHRYDPHQLGMRRRNWQGMTLDDALPSKHRHGRRIVKRCLSFSDGDASPETSEPENGINSIASDCNEYFDADMSFRSTRSTSTDDEPSPEFEDGRNGTMPKNEDGMQSVTSFDTTTSSRRFGNRFGDLLGLTQTEDHDSRRRHQRTLSGANNLIKAAKQKAAEQHQKVKDALEIKTAQLRNARFPKLWMQRRPSHRTFENA